LVGVGGRLLGGPTRGLAHGLAGVLAGGVGVGTVRVGHLPSIGGPAGMGYAN
jgi:hypothetical protein